MSRATILATLVFFIGGCAASTAQPPSPKPSPSPTSSATTAVAARLLLDRLSLPTDPNGFWSPLALSDNAAVLYLTPQVANAAERALASARLAVLDLATRRLRPLLTLRPGMQVASPSLYGSELAWVEMSATDLAGHGWRLHRTDLQSSADEIVAVDPGLVITSNLLTSHIPLTSLSAGGLLSG